MAQLLAPRRVNFSKPSGGRRVVFRLIHGEFPAERRGRLGNFSSASSSLQFPAMNLATPEGGEREIGTKVRWRWLPDRDPSCRLHTISGLFLALSFPDTIDSVLSIFRHSKLCQSLL